MNLSKAYIKYLSKEQENVNTKKKLNLYGLKLFMEFLKSEDERRELQEIPAAKLQQFAKKFLLGVRCQQGFYWHLHLLKVSIFTAHSKTYFCGLYDVQLNCVSRHVYFLVQTICQL